MVELAIAHVVVAGVLVFAVAQAAPVVTALIPRPVALLAIAAAGAAGIVVDSLAAARRGWSLGLSRQTPKRMLSRLGEHAWITPYVWGIDTGLIWTTYRVSFGSWLLPLLALTGIAPPWAGFVYGLAFAGPLLVLTRLRTRFRHPSQGIRPWAAAPIQVVGVASMLLLVAASSMAVVGAPARAAAGPCDDVAGPMATNPPVAPGAGQVLVGGGSVFFTETAGHRWRENVVYEHGTYFAKLGMYTLDRRPPAVTVRRVDGQPGVGRVEFAPTSQGLPGWLPTGVYVASPGCWSVTARGSRGQTTIKVDVLPHR